jgi:hypothetical protein
MKTKAFLLFTSFAYLVSCETSDQRNRVTSISNQRFGVSNDEIAYGVPFMHIGDTDHDQGRTAYLGGREHGQTGLSSALNHRSLSRFYGDIKPVPVAPDAELYHIYER